MRILQRYVLGQLLRVFGMLVLGLTGLLVFVGVAGEAATNGLGPVQIVKILPFIIPSLLPFTIPATLLLTVCVVYGRMSSDNEITATKAAGISVVALLWPSFVLGAVLSLGTLILTDQFIPWARANIENVITLALEDIFLERLRSKSQFNDVDNGMSITVIRVVGKRLIQPTIRYTPRDGGTITIQAREATIKFDLAKQVVRLKLYKAEVEAAGDTSVGAEDQEVELKMPSTTEATKPRNIPIREINEELAGIRKSREEFENRRISTLAFALTQGAFDRLSQPEFQNIQPQMRNDRFNKLTTEVHSRVAMACSCFCFVLFGSPFSILQGRRQFLTNFLFCFLPILLLYYPAMLLMMNLGKSHLVAPWWGMWVGNGLLLIAAAVVLRKVRQH